LGLSIVRHLVDLHGGTVEARSDGKNRGASFVVSLPLLPREEQSAGIPHVDAIPDSPLSWMTNGTELPRASVTADALPGVRLLVVDDEPATRDMLTRVLTLAGATVKAVDSAMAARQTLTRWKPDVLISDIGMPSEDGYALIKFVRALHPDDGGALPAIALTAYARKQDCEATVKAGYQMHLAKPIMPADLVDAVLQLIKNSAA
jgi:CheY-like chemotaxis protein